MYKVLFVILSLCLVAVTGLAEKPPPPKPLAERVNLATHVFIGKATSVRAVRVVGGTIEEIAPEPARAGSGVMVEVELKVEEVMFPASWKPSETTKVYFAGGIFSINGSRQIFLADRYVYLTQEVSLNREKIFIPSYPWHLIEGLDKQQEISAVLARRVSN